MVVLCCCYGFVIVCNDLGMKLLWFGLVLVWFAMIFVWFALVLVRFGYVVVYGLLWFLVWFWYALAMVLV